MRVRVLFTKEPRRGVAAGLVVGKEGMQPYMSR
jgi:hypothetical protein